VNAVVIALHPQRLLGTLDACLSGWTPKPGRQVQKWLGYQAGSQETWIYPCCYQLLFMRPWHVNLSLFLQPGC